MIEKYLIEQYNCPKEIGWTGWAKVGYYKPFKFLKEVGLSKRK